MDTEHGQDHLGEHIVEAVIIGSILRSPAGQWLCGRIIVLFLVGIGWLCVWNPIQRHFEIQGLISKVPAEVVALDPQIKTDPDMIKAYLKDPQGYIDAASHQAWERNEEYGDPLPNSSLLQRTPVCTP